MLPNNRADTIKLLKKVPFFEALSQNQLNEIAKHADVVPMGAGSMVAKQGAPGSEFVLILSGEVQVMKMGKVLRTMKKGEFFGEVSLIDGGPRTASVLSKSDINLLVIHKRSFDHLMNELPGLQKKMLITLCKYLRRAEQGIV